MQANAEVKWAIFRAVDTLFDHIANGRLTPSIECFSDDPDVTMTGSEIDEVAIGRDALRDLFFDLYAQPYRIIFTMSERRVSAHGHVAWLTGEGTYRLSTEDAEHAYRLTGIFERRRDRWLWQVFAGSEPR